MNFHEVSGQFFNDKLYSAYLNGDYEEEFCRPKNWDKPTVTYRNGNYKRSYDYHYGNIRLIVCEEKGGKILDSKLISKNHKFHGAIPGLAPSCSGRLYKICSDIGGEVKTPGDCDIYHQQNILKFLKMHPPGKLIAVACPSLVSIVNYGSLADQLIKNRAGIFLETINKLYGQRVFPFIGGKGPSWHNEEGKYMRRKIRNKLKSSEIIANRMGIRIPIIFPTWFDSNAPEIPRSIFQPYDSIFVDINIKLSGADGKSCQAKRDHDTMIRNVFRQLDPDMPACIVWPSRGSKANVRKTFEDVTQRKFKAKVQVTQRSMIVLGI